MKILVLGAGGMAGHVIATYLSEQGHDISTVSANNKLNDATTLIDVQNSTELLNYFSSHDFDVVINCIGILVKQSEARKDLASYLNGYLPHLLEQHFHNKGTKVIHLSTDCVFSGKNAPYYEQSSYDGDTFYDRSKALGEIINSKDLTFRMSIIGPDMKADGIGLFNWFMAQSDSVNGYTGAIWSGITTIELAKGISKAIEQNLTGLYHLVPKNNISKYELLRLFAKVYKNDRITVNPDNTVALDKTLINSRDDFNYSVPNYEVMLNEMKQWINDHRNLYEHYGSK